MTVGLWLTRTWSRSLSITLLLVQVAALVSTLSRTSWVALAVGVFALVFFATRRWRLTRILTRSYLLLVLASIAIPFLLRKDSIIRVAVERTINRGVSGRGELWLIGLDTLAQHALAGVGFGMTRREILEPIGSDFRSLHNSYIQLAAETGILGPVIFVVIIVVALYVGVHRLRRNRLRLLGISLGHTGNRLILEEGFMTVGCAAVLGLATYCLAESIMFQFHVAGYLWTYILATTSTVAGSSSPRSGRQLTTERHAM